MHRLLLPFVLVATACGPQPDFVRYTYGGGEGLTVEFLPVDGGPAAEGALSFAGASADHLEGQCPPDEARFTTYEGSDGGGAGACMDATTGFPEVAFTGLAGPLPLHGAGASVEGGRFDDADLTFDETDDARVSVEFDDTTGRVVDLSDDGLEGAVEVDAAFEHVGPRPDHPRTEWVQTVRFSWSFDRSVRHVDRLYNEAVITPEAATPE